MLPLLLERAGLTYTGSSPLTLGLAVHKHKAKDVLRGFALPPGTILPCPATA